jgi:signal peptidase I
MFDARTLEKIPVKARRSRKDAFVDIIKYIVVSLVVITPIRMFVAQPFIVSGASMDPTFKQNEYLVIDQMTYRTHAPARGDVIIFRYPLDPDTYFIKRVIGLPGESVDVTDGIVTVIERDGSRHVLSEPYLGPDVKKKESAVTKLDRDEYFVLGDNRKASADSRVWGPLPKKFIMGRAFARLLPLNKVQLLPGEYPLHL